MSTTSPATAGSLPPSELHPGEQRIVIDGISWEQYEAIEAAFEEVPGVRLIYLEGALEIMTTSFNHELWKTCIARLLEAYADVAGVSLNGAGEATLLNRETEVKLEPDECYFVGPRTGDIPDLAIEIALTSGGLPKLEVYRRLGVPEVWIFRDERLSAHVLEAGRYVPVERSRLLPRLDLDQLLSFVDFDRQTEAARAYRAALVA